MRLALRGSSVVERLAIRLGLVPTPAAEAWAGMATSGVLVAAVRLGLTARLAAGPATADELARDLDLDPTPTRLLLDCLRSINHVTCRGGQYALSRQSQRWLDPSSDLSVGSFVAGAGDYWAWWSALPEATRSGQGVRHHDAPPDDPYWHRYVTGQADLARLSVAEVVAGVSMPMTDGPRSLLDIGGGHGLYAVELCRKNPRLTATVLDLAGSARIGREIVAEAGMGDRVRHLEGDALSTELGGPYELVLCFNVVHHLAPEQIVGLFTRIHDCLAPGGSLAVLDAFADPTRSDSAAASFLSMFLFLSSGVQGYAPDQLYGWLNAAGFGLPRKRAIRRVPGLTLYQATPGNLQQ
jgi:ubiquinone/menaquinone biosynthesis C-methylase UbiE